MKNKKGFTLIELLTVIAILAVILLIAAPIILGVLDKARKNTFKNQVLLYVEGLKQQTALALMGSGYSELQKIDEGFYAPTSDSENKLVRVSTTDLNKIMDAPTLANAEYYFYVESTTQGYNYYIGQDVNQENGYKTTCAYATGNEACESKTYGEDNVNLINSKVFALVHIQRSDLSSSSGGNSSTSTSDEIAPQVVSVALSGDDKKTLTISASDNVGVTNYCVTKMNDSSSCVFGNSSEISVIDYSLYYVFVKDAAGNISVSKKVAVLGNNGNAITLGGYNWHVYGQTNNNDGNDKVFLIMDAGQLSNMGHCVSSSGLTNNCTLNGEYYVYSWNDSTIKTYLNTTFKTTLIANDSRINDFLKVSEICKNSSISSSDEATYGGYTKEEIQLLVNNNISATCSSGYTNDYVRLITPSEYHNLTSYSNYASASYPITGYGNDNGQGKIPNLSSYITRMGNVNWIYGLSENGIGEYWTTGAFAHTDDFGVGDARIVLAGGDLSSLYNENSRGVRPVIVLQK